MKEFMKRIDVIVILVLVASIGLNIYFLNQKPKEVIHTITEIKEVEKPVIITKIITKYETKLITENLIITSDIDKIDAYDKIIVSELEINTNPLTIIEDKNGKFYIPESLTGNARLAFLEWDVDINLKPKTIWQQKILPLDLGAGLTNLKPDLGLCVDIPFLTDTDIMIGFNGVNIGWKRDLTKNSKLRIGLGIDYEKNLIMFLGLRTNIF